MKKPGLIAKAWGSLVTMFLILVSLTAATYAWFSSNRVVDTDRVQTRSGTASLNAARLGLIFGDQGTSRVIFYLSESSNDQSSQVRNTYLNGTKLGDQQVLDGSSGTVRQANDPSVSMDTYTIEMNGENTVLPEKPLLYMELNQIYPVDIYFYLEGCDPDCSDSISYHSVDLHLAFYGVLTETEGGSGG